jgi:hypothetical protein
MAGMGQDNMVEFSAALEGEDQLRSYLHEREQLKNAHVADIVASLDSMLPDVDRAVLTGELGEDLAARFRAAVRTGVEGWLEDDIAFTRPWGFGLEEISVPVMIWQGSADLMVPFSHGQWLASQLPGRVGTSGRRRGSSFGRVWRTRPHARRTRECGQTRLAPLAETRLPLRTAIPAPTHIRIGIRQTGR